MNFHKKMSSIPENTPDRPVIALAGNPNVGKSTLFNNLTSGKKCKHTGNWIGKSQLPMPGEFAQALPKIMYW